MSTHLILQGGDMQHALEIDRPSEGKLIDAVRELARDGALPLYWRCGQGTCGACIVWLEHAHSAQALPLTMGGRERNVLARMGKLDATQQTAPALPDTPELPRLACHVSLAPGWLKIRW